MKRAAFASILSAALVLGAAALPARAAIFRCTAPSGEVTYQQAPCAQTEDARLLDVPESYPAANPSERERLFAREAALDRRLEAQRERESREATARAAAEAAAAPPPAPQAEPQIAWILPPFLARHRHAFARHGMPSRPRGY
jgi:Skp family chaperone for outer membrane proteins